MKNDVKFGEYVFDFTRILFGIFQRHTFSRLSASEQLDTEKKRLHILLIVIFKFIGDGTICHSPTLDPVRAFPVAPYRRCSVSWFTDSGNVPSVIQLVSPSYTTYSRPSDKYCPHIYFYITRTEPNLTWPTHTNPAPSLFVSHFCSIPSWT